MARRLRLTKFRELSLDDPFFDSLKAGYGGFPEWFTSKADEDLYVVDDDGKLSGMIYLKREAGPIADVTPPLPAGTWLKVSTLKIEGKGTKLGERVLKKIFDAALAEGADGIYVTVFSVHKKLIELFKRYGFTECAFKETEDGTELVLARSLRDMTGDLVADYPFIHTAGQKAWLLAVYPEYHSRLLPDSILNNEPREIIQDVSHTNTIHKIYIGKLALTRMSPGDAVILYRTTDRQGHAYYRSVVTSVCVVEEVRTKRNFADVDAFVEYCRQHSVFSEDELREQFLTSPRLYLIKMTYNAAFGKRLTRGALLDAGLVSEQPRWDLRSLSQRQLRDILGMGNVNARLIVD
ncbi:GNAT family N-acetyltransferase [Microvirga terricola]|uniref:GNAT family N-acetyltransferase n=1 Tax=Microvirga terricola TaxID=2719797 RepID=A0ABX0VCF1_9HYPH|nr:GNAT family N-acetyltransferase [Microvirga terricola]NIX77368.1 GNAT family N-acetyltransferase [Microvirga terricola]